MYDTQPMQGAVSKESSICSATARLSEEIASAHNNVDHLETKLGAVLAGYPSESPGGSEKATDPSLSSLGSELNNLYRHVHELNRRLRTLTEAVDL